MSPLEFYQKALEDDKYQLDKVQYLAVKRLNDIYHALNRNNIQRKTTGWDLFGKINNLIIGYKPVRGLYMWGGVGRGKTWLMDIFFNSIPSIRKERLHLHCFMLRIHQRLNNLQGYSDPLTIIAEEIKKEIDLLCIDEFFITDIADAMLIGSLIKPLFHRGITLIATSNIPPEKLYLDGLHRTQFLSTIKLIKDYCQIIHIDSGIDYRLRMLKSAYLWLTPLCKSTTQKMVNMFTKLVGQSPADNIKLNINNRCLPTLGMIDGVLAINFITLCGIFCSQYDYIEITKLFHTVFLHDVTVMMNTTEDRARRFLNLVDELYDHNVKLIVSAEVSLDKIYQGSRLQFEYQRCISRLHEMQSEEYYKRSHLP